MIADFINILRNAKLEPTAIDIAEMLIVAAYIPAPAVPAPVKPDLKGKEKTDTRPATDQPPTTPDLKADPLKPTSAPQTMDAGGLFVETEEDFAEGEGGVETVPFRTPKASALPGAHKIARSLRPLRRRHPSNRHFILDEERTIRQIADGGPHTPVMKPAPERWLDMALVFDTSLTMQLWRSMLEELQRLFEQCGVFRDVRLWHLDTDDSAATLYSAVGKQATNAAHSWRELLDPTRRRLIVVVSDCHAESWHNGDAYRLLTDWGMQSPVALVQVLPERFWPATTMTPVDVTLRAYRPGLTNQWLTVAPIWYRDLIRAGGLPLPVVTLEEWSIAPWARMIAGSSGVTSLGLIIPPLPERDEKRVVRLALAAWKSGKQRRTTNGPANDSHSPSAQERVKAFSTNTSPMARQLACYLASAPLTFPVMQLVQQTMLPHSRQSHLAEIFLGGLIYQPSPKGDRKTKPDEIIFEFHDGVRDELINRITKAETVMVITAVSRYIEQRLGEGGEFGALLALPGPGTGGPRRRLDPLSRRFAQLSTTILRRFGGYESHLAQIETLFNIVDPTAQAKEPESEFQNAESLVKQADSLLSHGKMAEAEILYQRVLGLLPSDDRAWRGLAEIVRRGLGSEESLRVMLAGLRHNNEFARKTAAETVGLGGITAPEFIDALLSAMLDDNDMVRSAAFESLLNLGNEQPKAVSSALAGALRDENSQVRAKAAIVLGNIGDKNAILALRNALQDGDAEVYRAVADALEKLGAATEQKSDAEERVDRFRSVVSDEAYNLAIYLSVVPLTLPVMRLVHHTMIRNPQNEQLDEVLLSQIIHSKTPPEEQRPLDEAEYEFYPGVREILRGKVGRSELDRILQLVSNFITQQSSIFISYVREDTSTVETIYHRLLDEGFAPWMDRFNIPPGQDWKNAIGRAISESDFLLLCLSRNSTNKSSYFYQEVRLALNVSEKKHRDNVYLIPILLEKCELPEEVNRWPRINLYEDDGWNQLLRAIRSELRRRRQSSRPQLQSLLSGIHDALTDTLNLADALNLVDQLREMTAIDVCRLMDEAGITYVAGDRGERLFVMDSTVKYDPVSPGGEIARQLLIEARRRCTVIKSPEFISSLIPLRSLNSKLIAETKRINEVVLEAADGTPAPNFITLDTDNQRTAALRTAVDLSEEFPDGLLFIDLEGRKISQTEVRLACLNPFVKLGDDPMRSKLLAEARFIEVFSQKRVLIIFDKVDDLQELKSFPQLPRGSVMIVIKGQEKATAERNRERGVKSKYWLMSAAIYIPDIQPMLAGRIWPYERVLPNERLKAGDIVYLVEGYGELYAWGYVTKVEAYQDVDLEKELLRVSVSRPVVRAGLLSAEQIKQQPSLAKLYAQPRASLTELDADQVKAFNQLIRSQGVESPADPSRPGEELLEEAAKAWAEQAAQMKTGVPAGVLLGPLTSAIRNGAVWANQDQFPSDQSWADEAERILSFAQVQGRFERYLGRLRGNARLRSSALAELRVAFFLSRNEFRIVEWEPIGANNREGEFTIRIPAGTDVFVEVKGPSWEAELSDKERASGRKEMPKHLHAEVRSIAPWVEIQAAIDKAYGKFRSDISNLLIIADDLFVSLEHGTGLNVGLALYDPDRGGRFTDTAMENLGGVGIFWAKHNEVEVWYEMKLFLNPHALPAAAIPEELARAFNAVDHVDRW